MKPVGSRKTMATNVEDLSTGDRSIQPRGCGWGAAVLHGWRLSSAVAASTGRSIARAARSLYAECRLLGGCDTGDAKATTAGRLPARWVVQCPVGPVWQGGEAGEAGSCYASAHRRSLEVAREAGRALHRRVPGDLVRDLRLIRAESSRRPWRSGDSSVRGRGSTRSRFVTSCTASCVRCSSARRLGLTDGVRVGLRERGSSTRPELTRALDRDANSRMRSTTRRTTKMRSTRTRSTRMQSSGRARPGRGAPREALDHDAAFQAGALRTAAVRPPRSQRCRWPRSERSGGVGVWRESGRLRGLERVGSYSDTEGTTGVRLCCGLPSARP